MPLVCGHAVDNLVNFGEKNRDETGHIRQPGGLDEESFFQERDGDYPLSHPFWDSCFSDQSWGVPQPSARNGMDIDDPQAKAMGHGIESLLSASTRQPTPTTALSRGDGVGVEDATNVAAMTASGPKPSNRFQCLDCGKILSRHDSLKRHQETQHTREVVEHLCPHKPCKRSRHGSGFSRPDGLRRHLKACKSKRRWAATRALGLVDYQLDSGNETREESQARSFSHDTRSTEPPNGTSSQQSPAHSLIVGLRKRLAEAEAVRDRAKREYEEAQRKVESYEMTIGMLEKERTA